MNILGLSFDYHDAAAALVQDGDVVAASQEERFSRKKHDERIPLQAVSFCLQQGNITAGDLDAVVFYENTALKWDRIVWSYLQNPERAAGYLSLVTDAWFHQEKFDTEARIADLLGIDFDRILSLSHHESHAASAYYCSPFKEAAIVTMDGVGEYETTTVSTGSDNTITKLSAQNLPHSIGLLYSAITAFLGFEVNEGEYKVMGMAGFGDPSLKGAFRKLITTTENGLFEVAQDYFDFLCPIDLPFNDKLLEILGPPRTPGEHFDLAKSEDHHYANIAASLQDRIEEVILHIISHAMEAAGSRNVCLAGGVGLNSLANARAVKDLGCNLYVQPAAGDAGGALGAALAYYFSHGGAHDGKKPLVDLYLGRQFSDTEILSALNRHWLSFENYFDEESMIEDVAGKLAAGSVIGWMQGRAEWGPRALGNRSILADPTNADMQNNVNTKIKFREPFRPFAPSVLAEHADEYFNIEQTESLTSPENFMLAVVDVLPNAQNKIPAVTHVDGTARVHLVHREINPLYYRLIEAFQNRTGTPILLNTSMNLNGEAVVNAPYDALETFSWSNIDYMVIGHYIISKESLV